jgi:hypothetical protein
MGEIGNETDLSRERPSRRSWWPSRRFAGIIGGRLRTPRRQRPNPGTEEIQVARTTDLPKLEGDPTDRADPGLVKFGAHARPLRGEVEIQLEAPAESPQATAMTVVILLGLGAVLSACGVAVGAMAHLPLIVAAPAVLLLFFSPLITFAWLGRRN